MPSFQDYINVLKSGIIKHKVKLEWLRDDETLESEFQGTITDLTLSINRNNGVRRILQFTAKNEPYLLPSVWGVWINRKIKLYLGVECSDGDYFIPQGVFVLSNPSYESNPSGSTVTFNATDKFTLLNGESGGGLLTDIYLINAGTPVNTAINTILTTFKDKITPIIYPNSITYPYQIRKGYGDNIGEILKDTAYFMSYNIFYDANGVLNLLPDTNDDVKASQWDYNSQSDGYCYLGATMESDFVSVRNVVKVIGNNLSNSTAIIGIAKNTDYTSNSNIYTLGEIPYAPVENSYINTQLQADNLAQFILKRVKILNASIDINSIPMYHLDVDTVITITDTNLDENMSRYLINSINLHITPEGGDMTINCVKTDEVDFTVGKVD